VASNATANGTTTDGVAKLIVGGIKTCCGECAAVSGLSGKSLTNVLDFYYVVGYAVFTTCKAI